MTINVIIINSSHRSYTHKGGGILLIEQKLTSFNIPENALFYRINEMSMKTIKFSHHFHPFIFSHSST